MQRTAQLVSWPAEVVASPNGKAGFLPAVAASGACRRAPQAPKSTLCRAPLPTQLVLVPALYPQVTRKSERVATCHRYLANERLTRTEGKK